MTLKFEISVNRTGQHFNMFLRHGLVHRVDGPAVFSTTGRCVNYQYGRTYKIIDSYNEPKI